MDEGVHWDDIYRQITEDILNGANYSVNVDLHLKTAQKLIEAVSNGFAENGNLGKPNIELINALKRNIYPFSVAKSFTQMQYFRNAMIGEDGTVLSKESFIKKIADTGEVFNKKYLSAEYENAFYSAIMADKWNRFADDEILEYSTAGDAHVRPSHQALDKFTAPKSHPIWRKIYTPNGWGCRCNIVPGKKQNIEKTMTANEAGKMMKPELKGTPFDNNVGISEVIFKDNHPYFRNTNGKEVNLSWEQYGLPSYEKIRTESLPKYTGTTKNGYFDWWKNQPKHNGDDIKTKDVLGNDIILPSGEGKNGKLAAYFKDHILLKEAEQRFEFATEAINVLTNPDEVWLNPLDKNTISYIKYYENGVLKLVVNDKMEAQSFYQLDAEHSGSYEKARKGVLMYKN